MSYILDALRRADAQRERDPARGIHAQPLLHAATTQGAPRSGRAWLLALALVGAVVLAAIAWFALRPAEKTEAATAAPLQVPAAEPPRAAAPDPLPAAEVVPPAPPGLAPVATRARGDEAVELTPTRPAPGSAPAAAASAASAELPLPADGAGMPKLTISGGVYSDAPAQRMLIVNGQVLNEGNEAAPGVVLEQIRPRSAVLSFRGQRYTVAY